MGPKSEVCNMLCTTHALPQNVIIFAAVYEVSYYPHFTDGETSASELCDLPRAREGEDSNPDLPNRKVWFLAPHASQTPASPPFQLAQSMGCGPGPSPLSAVSSALAAPGPAASRVHAQCSFSAMWACTRILAPRPSWGCHGSALPLDCLVGPTSHWNVSEIPPFRPASKPALPDSHSHYDQQENLFRSCPGFQFGKQMATIARPPHGLYFPFPFHSVLSLSLCPRACGGYRHRQSLSSNFSFSVSQTFDFGLVLGFDFLVLHRDDNDHICILDFYVK